MIFLGRTVNANAAENKIPYTRLCYDLALIYTKIKFEQAVEDGLLPKDSQEFYNDEIEYLVRAFAESFKEITKQDEKTFFNHYFSK